MKMCKLTAKRIFTISVFILAYIAGWLVDMEIHPRYDLFTRIISSGVAGAMILTAIALGTALTVMVIEYIRERKIRRDMLE